MILTAEQQAAVGHPPVPLRIVAGAGTGKTTVMVERIARLIATGQARPDQVLGLTFTNKAAAELKQRVEDRLSADADITVSTYHGFGASLVAQHALELDLHPRTRLLNRAEAWQLLFGVFDEFRFDKRRVFRPGTVVNDGLLLASRCADHLVEVAELEEDCRQVIQEARWKATRDAATGRLELCQVVAAYNRRKRERHLIDYDDQIRLAVRLLEDNPELARSLAVQYPAVLLDEYQDTNYAQRVLLQLVYGPGSTITAVGDDMQSIYAFRGAHLRNILDFGEHFPPLSERALTENRRSGPAIVELANRIQGQVSEALAKTLVARPEAPDARVECWVAADDAEEAATIAADIGAAGPPWAERAVLCRKRRLIPAIVAALEGASLPVEVAGSSGLLDRPEVVDLVAWLEILADLSATVALLRILRGPRYRIGWRDLAALARHSRAQRGALEEAGDHDMPFSLADALEDLEQVADLSPIGRGRLLQFCRLRQELSQAAARLPVLDLAEAVAARTGLWQATGERGRENVLRFLDLIQRFSPVHGSPGLGPLIEYLHVLDESEEDLAEAHTGARDAVAVLTIHQAKGLEWDDVWVPGLAGSGSSRIFPDGRSGENALTQQTALPWWLRRDAPGLGDWRRDRKEDMDARIRRRSAEEEWRLLYVACTRARRRLVCSAAQWYPGPSTAQGPSEFYELIAGQTDLVSERFRHEPPTLDPQVAAMERRRATAGAAQRGWAGRPVEALDQGSLFETPAGRPESTSAPNVLSVTAMVSYRRCPRQFYWLAIRPLPRRRSEAALLGTEIHRWIEQRSDRQLGLIDLEDEEVDPGAAGGTASGAGGWRAAFLRSPYGSLDPERVEAPFVLVLDGRMVRGRVDAVYRRDQRLELVDFKTGSAPADGDRGAGVQLDLYAMAAVDVWREDPAELRTTYCYLRGDGTYALVSTDWDEDRLAVVRADLRAALTGLAAGEYAATPGPWCGRCEWREVCRPGRAYLEAP